MDHNVNETGCQAAPERPMLCVNNCGFFGSATNINMCSKCYKDHVMDQAHEDHNVMNQVHDKLAALSIENNANGSSAVEKEVVVKSGSVDVKKEVSLQGLNGALSSAVPREPNTKESGPNRCTSCKKRVGLTAFKCRCGNMFCASHRYSEKHDCTFDYRSVGQLAIAKANPVVKADKLVRI